METSDREVNIKILVDRLVARGELSSEERASFIESLQDEVGGKGPRDQASAERLLQGEFHGSFLGTNLYKRLMHDLEEHAGLNRAVEFLPTDGELDERLETTGDRLTRPELAVLAAYVKIYLTQPWSRPTSRTTPPGGRAAQLLPGSTRRALRSAPGLAPAA